MPAVRGRRRRIRGATIPMMARAGPTAPTRASRRRCPTQPDWTFFSWDDGFVFTSPVASFKANAFGLYDMIGNALQWCQDHYGEYKPEPPPTRWGRILTGGRS